MRVLYNLGYLWDYMEEDRGKEEAPVPILLVDTDLCILHVILGIQRYLLSHYPMWRSCVLYFSQHSSTKRLTEVSFTESKVSWA